MRFPRHPRPRVDPGAITAVGRISRVNAVERYRVASEANDIDALMEALPTTSS